MIRKENLSEIVEREECGCKILFKTKPSLNICIYHLVTEVDYLYKENISYLYFSGCFFLRILVNDFLIFIIKDLHYTDHTI